MALFRKSLLVMWGFRVQGLVALKSGFVQRLRVLCAPAQHLDVLNTQASYCH